MSLWISRAHAHNDISVWELDDRILALNVQQYGSNNKSPRKKLGI